MVGPRSGSCTCPSDPGEAAAVLFEALWRVVSEQGEQENGGEQRTVSGDIQEEYEGIRHKSLIPYQYVSARS